MLIVEMAAYYKAKGMTLYDALVKMFEKYGHYTEHTVNVTMPGLDGVEKMKALMNELRKNPPAEIGGKKVVAIRDYQAETITDLITGAVTPTGLPASNVLYFECEGGNVVVVRPSGTEPKIKLYLLVNGACENCCKTTLEAFKKTVETWT